MPVWKITRRTLLTAAAGGTVVAGGAGLWLGVRKLETLAYRNGVSRSGFPFTPSIYLAIQNSGETVIWIVKSEMGQGIGTALATLIAEELDADWQQVRIEQAVAGPEYTYEGMFTAASSSIAGQWTMLRRAGAAARDMLVHAAAERWQVSTSECETLNGQVIHTPTNRRANYGDLADLAARQWPPLRPSLKEPSQFRLIGRSPTRLDLHDKVTGQAQYGIDVELPGLLRAVVLRRSRLTDQSVSETQLQSAGVDGIVGVVQLQNGVAIVAETTHAAMKGRQALENSWPENREISLTSSEIRQRLVSALDDPPTAESRMLGDPDTLPVETDSFSAVFTVPYLAHVCMEPMNCTAHVTNNHCEVWAPTQNPQGARRTAADVAGVPIDSVTVNVTQLGGGFGRRAANDFVAEAVELAGRVERPVQVIWTREDDIRHGLYRPAAAIRLAAKTNTSGLPQAWQHRIACANAEPVPAGSENLLATMGADDLCYGIANLRVDWTAVEIPVATTIWRSVGYSFNTFAVECFIDELAHRHKSDPYVFRHTLLSENPRLQRCLEVVADMADWSSASSRHLGIAVHAFGDTSVAQIVEVNDSGDAGFKLLKVWCAVDCGIVVHTDTAKSQIQGGIVDGLSAALYGGLDFENGRIRQSNFHDYRLIRMDEAPTIEVQIVASAEHPSGIGEASLPGAAPALANALFSLRGERVRQLPILSNA